MLSYFDIAVKLIADDYEDECKTQRCSLRELFKAYMMSDKDIKTEFLYILQRSDLDTCCFDNDCNITNADGTKKSFKCLKTAVFNYNELKEEF